MTSEQRIAVEAIAFAKGFSDALSIPLRPDALSLLEQSTGDLIASVRAEAIEEAAKVCDEKARVAKEIWDSFVAECHKDTANIGRGSQSWHQYYESCAFAIRALVKERKG